MGPTRGESRCFWTGSMESWTGLLDWIHGVLDWTGCLEFSSSVASWHRIVVRLDSWIPGVLIERSLDSWIPGVLMKRSPVASLRGAAHPVLRAGEARSPAAVPRAGRRSGRS
eukprot:gene13500-biopygen11254